MAKTAEDLDLGRYQLGWSDVEDYYVFKPKKGLNEDIVREMSWMKGEPQWMTDRRLKALRYFERRPMPTWGGDMSGIDFDNIFYYIKPIDKQVSAWDQLPDSVKATYDKLGIPEAERKYLAGVTAQYESEVVYHRNRDDLASPGCPLLRHGHCAAGVPRARKGVLRQAHPAERQQVRGPQLGRLVGRVVHLRPARGEGGHAAPGLLPDQRRKHGPVRADPHHRRRGREVHYIEGCSAPVYTTDSLHSAVVEIVCKQASRVTYTTIQNWSNNVFNLVTKRARCDAEAHMEWIDGNIGSRLTMKYPAVYLMGPKASGEVLSVAYAGAGQHQDAGAKMVHAAPETTSTIISKSISKDAGRTSYRGSGPLRGGRQALEELRALRRPPARRKVPLATPTPTSSSASTTLRWATRRPISKVGDDQLFYLMSRGLSEQQAMSMIVNGFIEPVTRTLPMEYAVEWSRLDRAANGGQRRLKATAAPWRSNAARQKAEPGARHGLRSRRGSCSGVGNHARSGGRAC